MTAVEHTNVAGLFFEKAACHPEKTALVIPRMDGTVWSGDTSVTYGELVNLVRLYQEGFRQHGYRRGDRIVLMLQPSVAFYATVISMIGLGMVPVLIEMSMPRDRMAMAIEDSRARTLIGMRKLMRVFWLYKPLRQMLRYCVDGPGLGYRDMRELTAGVTVGEGGLEAVACSPADHGVISYIAGSADRPTGLDHTHSLLIEQQVALQASMALVAEDVDCSGSPMRVLHNLCSGMTTVMPRLDLTLPSIGQPSLLAEQLAECGITRFSASPSVMAMLGRYAQDNGLTFPHVRDVMTGGAPVPMAIAHLMHQTFPNARVHVTYGTAEADPITAVDYDQLVSLDGSRPGYLVGRPVRSVEVRVAPIGGVIARDAGLDACPQGETGEICVSGPHVVARYVDNPVATREYTVPRDDGLAWHRSGDTGYVDEAGRLWLTGRVKEGLTVGERSIEALPLEKCIDEMPEVQRAALVQQGPDIALVLQANDGVNLDSIARVLESAGLASVPVYRVTRMPVAGPYHSKIDRPLLRRQLAKGELTRFGESAPRAHLESRYIVQLNKVDLVTLSSVLTTGLAAMCALKGYVYAAMSILFLAMIADAMDGILARKLGLVRHFGRYLDGFMDVLIYLVTPALVMVQWGFDGAYGLFILLFIGAGCVRLAVFNEIGNVEDADGGLSYLGMPVFWSILILALAMLSSLVIPIAVSHALLAVALTAFSYFMVYRRPFFKFKSLVQILSVTLGGALFFAIWEMLKGSGAGLSGQFWTALYLAIPVIVGGVLHMIVVTKDLYPQLKIPVNVALFGANKTWRGFVVVPLCTMLGMLLLYPLERLQQWWWGSSVLEGRSLIALGLIVGLAYVVAELPNSFMKRRMGIAPGESPVRFKWAFVLMDQLDSIIGVALVYCLWLGYGVGMFLLLVLQSILVALFVKRLLFMARLKKAPN